MGRTAIRLDGNDCRAIGGRCKRFAWRELAITTLGLLGIALTCAAISLVGWMVNEW